MRFLRTGSTLLGGLVVTGLVVRYWIAPFNGVIAVTNLLSGLVLLSIPILIKKGFDRERLAILFLLAVASIGIASGLGGGGMKAPSSITLVLVPLLGWVLSSHRGAIVGLIGSLSSVLIILVAEHNELVLPFLNENRFSHAQGFIVSIMAVAAYTIGRVYEDSRTETETSLIQREQQIRTVIDSSPVGMVVIGENAMVQVLNRMSVELLPNLKTESSFFAALPESQIKEVKAFLEKSPRINEPESSRPNIVFPINCDEECLWVRLEAVPFAPLHADKPQILMTLTDVTEEVRAEEMRKAFIANSKMAALGEMAGGVAHEINNPLSIIVGKCGTLRNVLREENFDRARVANELEKIANTAGRIGKITSGLLAFARSGDQDPPGRVRVRDLIDETLAFCSDRFATAGIKMDIHMGGHEDILLTCRPSQISQVLLNLLNNAFDEVSNEAPPGKKQPEPWVRIEVELSESMLHFIVTDGGFGLPDTIRDKVFNPFFTTKPIGFGTGLGLSISKGLIESHGGSLTYSLDSRLKRHTSFRASIPLAPPNAS